MFPHPSPRPLELDGLVRGYEEITGDIVRSPRKRNLIATCYRVHGDDFLSLVRETFGRTGTATNLLGQLRVQPPREGDPVKAVTLDSTEAAAPGSPSSSDGRRDQTVMSTVGGQVRQGQPNPVEAGSGWCGCPEEDLRPDVLYCAAHRPMFGSAPKLRYDRLESNPAASRFFAVTARQPAFGAPRL